MPQIINNTYEAISGTREITIDGQKYDMRTRTVYDNKGQTGTIDTSKPIQYEVQYRQRPDLGNPAPSWTPLATKTEDINTNNGWEFTNVAGPGFKKKLVESGPNSLTSNLNTDANNALAKDAKVSVSRAQQALNTSPSKALPSAAANQDPTAAAGQGNKNQETEKDPFDSEKFSKNITSKNARNNFKKTRSGAPDGILVYPDGLRSTKQDVIKFDMLEYKPTKFGSDFGFESRSQNRTSIGTVILPIPSGISDTNSVTWGGPDMNALQAELARAALSGISGGVSGATDSLQSTAEKIAQNSGEVKTAVAAALAGEAAGVQGLLTRTTGAAINPNLELLFQGPALRPFSFTFKMSARNEKEAKTIISIIRFFKQGMSPQRSTSNLFLKSPHTFKIKYMLRGMNGQEHPFIGKIKECALQSFNVNYTPEGQYATFYDGKMVSYEVQMQFQELEPVFNDDYSELDKNADTQIGY